MRYTTIIDITEYPAIYRNTNVRLMYLHLCLIAGYHDEDRDICDISIRKLANDVGLTLSAARHALKILESMSFIRHQGSMIEVKKWISEKPITKRAKNKKEELQAISNQERIRQQTKLERELHEREQMQSEMNAKGKTSFMVYYETQIEKAAAGDADAIAAVKRHKSTYELHKKQMELEQTKNATHK